METRNPFSISYLTEASLTIDELLDRYSFLPFKYAHSRVTDATNMLIVGRKGVGKTMLLKLFDTDLLVRIFQSTSSEHTKVRELLPLSVGGVYLNLASPAARLSAFRGLQRDRDWWRRAYGDYLNCVLLESALRNLDSLFNCEAWSALNCTSHPSPVDDSRYLTPLLRRLKRESSYFDSASTSDDLKQALKTRVQHWARFVNGDTSCPSAPDNLLPFGTPLFLLASAVRRSGLLKAPFRLFVLIDQYEFTYQNRAVVDFRPIFNEAMYRAARGGTGVELKIGTRQYSLGDLELPNGGRLEMDREVGEVNLDTLAPKYYKKFAVDLFEKRLAGHAAAVDGIRPQELLPGLTPLAEAAKYAGRETGINARYITGFVGRWRALCAIEGEFEERLTTSLRDVNPLIGCLACIALTRWLKSKSGAPVGIKVPWSGAAPAPSTGGVTATMILDYVGKLVSLIDARYSGAAPRSGDDAARRVDNFVRDAEEAALFQLASAFKNQRKIFAGFDALVMLSSQVAVVLIDILRTTYDRYIVDGGDVRRGTVPPTLQSEAVYTVSESWFNRISRESDRGTEFQELLLGFGRSCRSLQLEAEVQVPCPNGFSFEAGVFSTEKVESRSEERVGLLMQAVHWGLLEEEEHQDKARGKARRRKLYLNRVFCPYFGVSPIHRKDPPYIRAADEFVTDCLAGHIPSEVRRILGRAGPDSQADLFTS